jgi:hypothetical protein
MFRMRINDQEGRKLYRELYWAEFVLKLRYAFKEIKAITK